MYQHSIGTPLSEGPIPFLQGASSADKEMPFAEISTPADGCCGDGARLQPAVIMSAPKVHRCNIACCIRMCHLRWVRRSSKIRERRLTVTQLGSAVKRQNCRRDLSNGAELLEFCRATWNPTASSSSKRIGVSSLPSSGTLIQYREQEPSHRSRLRFTHRLDHGDSAPTAKYVKNGN